MGQNINRAQCSCEDESAEEIRKRNRTKSEVYTKSQPEEEGVPVRWSQLSTVDRMMILGILVMLIAFWCVAIFFAARSIR